MVKFTREVAAGVPADLRLVARPRVVAVFQGRIGTDGVSRVVDAGAVTVQWVQRDAGEVHSWRLWGRSMKSWTFSKKDLKAADGALSGLAHFSVTVENANPSTMAMLAAGPVTVAGNSAACVA